MTSLTLKLREKLSQRIDMSQFTPERVVGKRADEIARTLLWVGNRQVETGQLFAIDGEASELLVIQSESDRLDRIGAGMTGGNIIIEGSAGAYLGYGMRDGAIQVSGNAGLAAGCAMRGGRLSIHGNAGDFLGGAITGERQGMRGGTIVLKGSAGDRAGDLMRRGTILIGGDSGDYCASRMVAGTLVVLGQTGIQTALAMRRGTLVTTKEPASLPATFNDNGVHALSFLTLLSHNILTETGMPDLLERGIRVRRWLGDLSCDGKGEILIWV
jgi:formylmethanofuran dehydrogenase subunit C